MCRLISVFRFVITGSVFFLVNLFYITVSLLPLFRVTAHRAMRFVGGGTGECVASGDDKIQEIWRGVMGYFVYLSKIGCGSAIPK